MNKYTKNKYLESVLKAPEPIDVDYYNSLSKEEKSMINIITPFFVYDENFNYRVSL